MAVVVSAVLERYASTIKRVSSNYSITFLTIWTITGNGYLSISAFFASLSLRFFLSRLHFFDMFCSVFAIITVCNVFRNVFFSYAFMHCIQRDGKNFVSFVVKIFASVEFTLRFYYVSWLAFFWFSFFLQYLASFKHVLLLHAFFYMHENNGIFNDFILIFFGYVSVYTVCSQKTPLLLNFLVWSEQIWKQPSEYPRTITIKLKITKNSGSNTCSVIKLEIMFSATNQIKSQIQCSELSR